MKKISLILCVFILCVACQRRGGNYSSNSADRHSQQTTSRRSVEERHRSTERATTSDQSVDLPRSKSSSRTYSGSEIFDMYSTAVFMVYTRNDLHGSQGSAFFISNTGIAVSNYHVFESTYQGLEEFHMSDGSVYKLKNVIAKSKEADVFIFEVDGGGKKFNFIPISSRSPRVGEKVYTIGSPQGLENTFSSGEISQLRGSDLIQISAPIDHGSSGGVLLNEYGEAIGITTAGIDDSGANLNFAVSIKLVQQLLQ